MHVQLAAHASAAKQAATAQRNELLSVISALEQEARQRAEGLEVALRTNMLELQRQAAVLVDVRSKSTRADRVTTHLPGSSWSPDVYRVCIYSRIVPGIRAGREVRGSTCPCRACVVQLPIPKPPLGVHPYYIQGTHQAMLQPNQPCFKLTCLHICRACASPSPSQVRHKQHQRLLQSA
eukprot:scaffold25274_cov21-Tisochrysis_lutea.AAC.1